MTLGKWWARLRDRLHLHQALSGPLPGLTQTAPTEPAPVEETAPQRKAYEAEAALPWTEDIARHNGLLDTAWEKRRTELREGYESGALSLPACFEAMVQKHALLLSVADDGASSDVPHRAHLAAIVELVDTILWQGSRTANVTGLKPLHAELSEAEQVEAAEAAALRRAVEAKESQRRVGTISASSLTGTAWEQRPSLAAVHEACGHNPTVIAQIEQQLDALYGPRETLALPDPHDFPVDTSHLTRRYDHDFSVVGPALPNKRALTPAEQAFDRAVKGLADTGRCYVCGERFEHGDTVSWFGDYHVMEDRFTERPLCEPCERDAARALLGRVVRRCLWDEHRGGYLHDADGHRVGLID